MKQENLVIITLQGVVDKIVKEMCEENCLEEENCKNEPSKNKKQVKLVNCQLAKSWCMKIHVILVKVCHVLKIKGKSF